MSTDDDHDGITRHDLQELDDLIRTSFSGVESLQIDCYEKIATVADEVTKTQDMLKHFAKRLTDIEFAIHRLANPGKQKPPRPTHDGDLIGSYD
jgi:hypothetical protein